ncbi:MAG TPA: two-component system response regulator [Treponema sp.]|nr:MAG: two-component system response regulator [Treponema sp. GWA1_62_8]OHE68319.1 MAG: two-component system response regulator [Treponema sp. GWC1_61_84]OHE70274.1 MAG: two-component system response regulator [Treponema sp. RIFOXYC1_FULL_61_9]HCM28166.1 two-component system response regulator [Treponema sp.]
METNDKASISTVLIVDDTPDDIALLTKVLKGTYRTQIAISGEKALNIASGESPPDLILLDIMMPAMDGYEVCRRLKEDPRTTDIPIIFLTAKSDIQDEQRGFELGAEDYLIKPLSPPIVMARLRTHLRLKNANDFLINRSEYLEKEVIRRTREISMIQDVAMVAMGSLAETRDNETGGHIRRTQFYIKALAERMRDLPQYKEFLTPGIVELLHKSAPLHDIGKVGIPDSILLKPGKLTPEEITIMKTHTVIGRDAIMASELLLDMPSSFLRFAREITWRHHEKWDGTGYPEGLSGNRIPVSGRLMALADVYDALISERVYKPAFPHEKAVSIIRESSGTFFDPDMVLGFLDIEDQFEEISQYDRKKEDDPDRG